MVTLLVNVAVLAFFVAVTVTVMLAARQADNVQPKRMSKRQFVVLVLGFGLLLIKFVLLGDRLLIIGQAALLLATLMYGLQAFFMPNAESQPPPERAEPPASMSDATAPVQRPPLKRKRPGRRRKLAAAAGVLMLIVGVAAVWVVRSFNTSSQGTLDKPQQAEQNAPAPKLVSFSGTRFKFNYMDYFSQSHTDAPSPPILESYIFVKHQLLTWQLAIQVESLPTGNLSDDGSYHFRTVSHDRYTDELTDVNGAMVHVFTDKKSDFNFGKTLFLQHQGLLAIISLNGGSPNDPDAMQTALLGIASSWQWL